MQRPTKADFDFSPTTPDAPPDTLTKQETQMYPPSFKTVIMHNLPSCAVTIVEARCPSCDHPFSMQIEIKTGGEKKTRLCDGCNQFIRFEYKLNMASSRKIDRLYMKEDWMRQKYVNEEKSMQEIADICGG